MDTGNKQLKELIKLLLPRELFDYFKVIDIENLEKEVHIYLDELNMPPNKFKEKKLSSKGFHSESIVQDFPIRDKATYLHIRRRRWIIDSSGEIVSRDWNSVAKGTHMTKDFAIFLKGILPLN
jgi:hypothetical protein